MMANDKGLETLQVWQKSLAFAVKVCKAVLPKMPVQEKWSLVDQLRRSAQSVPANIAEGYGRFYFQDSVRFCYIARGSLEETFSHLTLAYKLEYLNEETYKELNAQIMELRKMINGYIAFLKESKRGASEPGADRSIRESIASYIVNEEMPNAQSPNP